MKSLILLLITFFSLSAYANCDYNGNCYSTFEFGGQKSVRGYNYNTGSTWNATIDQGGNMKGYDSNNNYWQYNQGTGTYYNYGTGRMCTGSGYARQCF